MGRASEVCEPLHLFSLEGPISAGKAMSFFSLFLVDRAHWFRRVGKKKKQIVDHVDLHCRSPCTHWSVIIVDLRLHMLAKWISFHCQTVFVKSHHCCRVACAMDSEQHFCGCKLSVDILLGTWAAMGCDAVFFCVCFFFLSPSRIDFALGPWWETKKKRHTAKRFVTI